MGLVNVIPLYTILFHVVHLSCQVHSCFGTVSVQCLLCYRKLVFSEDVLRINLMHHLNKRHLKKDMICGGKKEQGQEWVPHRRNIGDKACMGGRVTLARPAHHTWIGSCRTEAARLEGKKALVQKVVPFWHRPPGYLLRKHGQEEARSFPDGWKC